MKKNVVQDERAVGQKHKIRSDTCNLLLGVLIISALVKEYIFKVPVSQYATEIICIFGAFIYIDIRDIIAGNDVYNTNYSGKKLVIRSLINGFIICVVVGTVDYVYGKSIDDKLFWLFCFVFSTIVSYLGFSLMHIINKKSQKKIVEELDKEENDIE
jgi:hypothetical protein